MTDSTPHLLLEETAGTGPATPYGGAGRRAVLPEPATNPPIGQSPASPYTAGLTEPLVRRAAAPRSMPSPPAPVSPVDLPTPVPAPSPARRYEEVTRLEEPSPYEPSPTELSPTELSASEPEDETPEAAPNEDVEPAEDAESVEPSPDVDDEDPYADDVPPDTVEPVEAEAEESVVAETSPVVPVAAMEEPVEPVAESTPLTSVPLIDRSPTPNSSRSLSAAQAYTAPIDPSMWFIGPMEESQAPPFVRVRRQGPERVDRGLLFAAVPLVVGCALSAALFHLGHIPSIVALAMGPAGALLYGKGAGSRPQAGAVKLIALLVVGVLLAWPVSLATELFFYYRETTGTVLGSVEYVVSSMLSVSLFMAKLKELLLVTLFGLGGVIAVIQTIFAASRKRRRSAAGS